MFHVAQGLFKANTDKYEIDALKLQPISRLGGNIYTTLGELIDMPRPSVN